MEDSPFVLKYLTKKEIIKVMHVTGKIMYELEKYYFEECCWFNYEETTHGDFIEPEFLFCSYFCDLALYNRVDGDIVDANESIEIEKLAEKVLIHIILTDKNKTGFSRIIAG